MQKRIRREEEDAEKRRGEGEEPSKCIKKTEKGKQRKKRCRVTKQEKDKKSNVHIQE
jgi:hypothetical protein